MIDGGQSGEQQDRGGRILGDSGAGGGEQILERIRRGEEVNREKTHFWREQEQAEFGVYLYE